MTDLEDAFINIGINAEKMMRKDNVGEVHEPILTRPPLSHRKKIHSRI